MRQNAAIIVFSGGIKRNGTLPFFVKSRLEKAYYIFQQKTVPTIIVSGKWGVQLTEEPKTTEADSMAEYLIELGVPKQAIIKERKSRDTISSIYYLKTTILEPRKIKTLYIVTSDFHKERAEYLLSKILGSVYEVHIISVLSNLHPSVLWDFFSYERRILLASKAYLRGMKRGYDVFLADRFFKSPFYKETPVGKTRELVFHGRIGTQSSAPPHYSLSSIFKKKVEVFKEYNLTESKFHRGSKVDFWSGRFLPFVGRDEKKTIHVLKFGLYPKDKKTFKQEIAITEFLKKQKISFIPTIIQHNITTAPIWYLYKAVLGKIAGRFSIMFSFEEWFYHDFVLDKLITYLAKIRSITDVPITLARWRSKQMLPYYEKFVTGIAKFDKKLSALPLLAEASSYFAKHARVFDDTPLYLSHADLHPANILVSPAKQSLYVIDFEHICFNSIAFDFCFLYVFSWNNPFFRKRLKEAFYNSLSQEEKIEFDRVFNPTYVFFLVWLLYFVALWEGQAGHERSQLARQAIFSDLKKIIKNPTISNNIPQ
jgi:uncharacterized SAM-binding protein YcdF (DUF218 family)/thiamine kinase-like enzyme